MYMYVCIYIYIYIYMLFDQTFLDNIRYFQRRTFLFPLNFERTKRVGSNISLQPGPSLPPPSAPRLLETKAPGPDYHEFASIGRLVKPRVNNIIY